MRVRNLWKQQLLIILCLFVLCLMNGCKGKESTSFQEVTLQETEQSTKEQKDNSESNSNTADNQTEDSIYVYVCGAVNQVGVYELKKDARVYEAIECAGGLCADAAVVAVNQAEIISDGQKIYIPTQEEYKSGMTANTASPQQNSSDGKIHLNTATKEQLTTLPGIGESRADSILAYREVHGSFQNIEELMNVEGIKEGIFQKIKEQIAL